MVKETKQILEYRTKIKNPSLDEKLKKLSDEFKLWKQEQIDDKVILYIFKKNVKIRSS